MPKTRARRFPPQTQLCPGNSTQPVTAPVRTVAMWLTGRLPAARGGPLAGPGNCVHRARVQVASTEGSDTYVPAPGPVLIAGVQMAPCGRTAGVGGLCLTHPQPWAACSAAGRLERPPEALGQGSRRGALRSAAHRQALGGQSSGGGGADGCKLRRGEERRGLSAPAGVGVGMAAGRCVQGLWDTLWL